MLRLRSLKSSYVSETFLHFSQTRMLASRPPNSMSTKDWSLSSAEGSEVVGKEATAVFDELDWGSFRFLLRFDLGGGGGWRFLMILKVVRTINGTSTSRLHSHQLPPSALHQVDDEGTREHLAVESPSIGHTWCRS